MYNAKPLKSSSCSYFILSQESLYLVLPIFLFSFNKIDHNDLNTKFYSLPLRLTKRFLSFAPTVPIALK